MCIVHLIQNSDAKIFESFNKIFTIDFLILVNWKEFIGIRTEDETTEDINDGADLTGPYFDANIPQNVTAIVGKSAFLRCKVRNLANKTVRLRKNEDFFWAKA